MARKRKIGSIERLGPDTWRVTVSCGYRTDGGRRRLRETVHGSYRDADMAAVRLYLEAGGDPSAGDSLTLSQYYWGIFRDGNSSRGTKRAATTLRGYDSQMRVNVLPRLGDRPLRSITHAEVKRTVLSATTPTKCKQVLGTVLRAAYDDGLIADKPMERRIPTERRRREQVRPWDALEVARAVEAFHGYRRPSLEMYLILGLSGLRTEEVLGVSPSDIEARDTYDVASGSRIVSLVAKVRATYTYDGGYREKTKTEFSARDVPVFYPCRGRLLELVERSRPEDAALVGDWASGRLVNLTYNQLLHAWRRACDELGLRYIPPDMLRHTSETLMQENGISDTLIARLHGHEDMSTDYGHYLRPGTAAAEGAARRLGASVPSCPRNGVYESKKNGLPPEGRPLSDMVGDEGFENAPCTGYGRLTCDYSEWDA